MRISDWSSDVCSSDLVEALSKGCQTSLEQQSENGRRNIEESCVCTHAKVPASSGLGLALGLMVVLLLCCGIANAQFHRPSEVTVRKFGQASVREGVCQYV